MVWLDWDLLNLGVSHQSNGRAASLLRSWNGAYAQFGITCGPFSLVLQPWLRFREIAATDDNGLPASTLQTRFASGQNGPP